MSRKVVVYLALMVVVVLSIACTPTEYENLGKSIVALDCSDIITTADSVQITIATSHATPKHDTVRMEMAFDTTQLSNPVVKIGTDFNVTVPADIQDNLFVGLFGRTTSGNGASQLATVTFDWTGEKTTISFVPGNLETGRGSSTLLVGNRTPFVGSSCVIK